MSRAVLVFLALLATGACATTPNELAAAADYSPIQIRPHERARLYADCIVDAVAHGAYGHASDDDANLILFTCTGPVARSFYEGLEQRSATIASEFAFDGRTYRSTERVRRNLFGVDYCSTGGAADYACIITLNAGEFLKNE